MNVELKSVINDGCSCNFCNRGQLASSGYSLIYPYDRVYEFQRETGGMRPVICDDCMEELAAQVQAIREADLLR